MEITLKVLFPRQIFDLATNFQRKFDNHFCNDVEKQSNFKKFDCLKADLSAFVETLKSASTSHFLSGFGKIEFLNLILHNTHCNGYEQISKEICYKIKDFVSKHKCFD